MKQNVWTALFAGLAVVALAVGLFLGLSGSSGGSEVGELQARLETLTQELATLERRVASLQATGQAFKVAYVDMFKVLQELQESELVKEALQKFRAKQETIQQEIEAVEQQFQQGEITRKERDSKVQELKLQLERLNLELSAPIQQEMLAVIRGIGEEGGYSLVIDNPASQFNAIVLYSQSGEADDITQEVVSRLSERLEATKKDGGEASGEG